MFVPGVNSLSFNNHGIHFQRRVLVSDFKINQLLDEVEQNIVIYQWRIDQLYISEKRRHRPTLSPRPRKITIFAKTELTFFF